MILVDTSVWSCHFRHTLPSLVDALERDEVVCHRWIAGELALGPGLRLDVLDHLLELRRVATVPDDAVLDFVRLHRLRSIDWVDAQLLVAALRAGVVLWTLDAGLEATSRRFGVAASTTPGT